MSKPEDASFATKRQRRQRQEDLKQDKAQKAELFEPNIILQVNHVVSSRIKEYLEEEHRCQCCFVPPKNITVLLFVRSPNPEVKF